MHAVQCNSPTRQMHSQVNLFPVVHTASDQLTEQIAALACTGHSPTVLTLSASRALLNTRHPLPPSFTPSTHLTLLLQASCSSTLFTVQSLAAAAGAAAAVTCAPSAAAASQQEQAFIRFYASKECRQTAMRDKAHMQSSASKHPQQAGRQAVEQARREAMEASTQANSYESTIPLPCHPPSQRVVALLSTLLFLLSSPPYRGGVNSSPLTIPFSTSPPLPPCSPHSIPHHLPSVSP